MWISIYKFLTALQLVLCFIFSLQYILFHERQILEALFKWLNLRRDNHYVQLLLYNIKLMNVSLIWMLNDC